jgi:hypothetical protein
MQEQGQAVEVEGEINVTLTIWDMLAIPAEFANRGQEGYAEYIASRLHLRADVDGQPVSCSYDIYPEDVTVYLESPTSGQVQVSSDSLTPHKGEQHG